MSELIADIYYLDAVYEVLPLRYRDSIMNSERRNLLFKHGITDSVYLNSMKFYNSNGKQMEVIEKLARIILQKRVEQDSINVENDIDSLTNLELKIKD